MELLRRQQARDARWRGLSFARNFGHQVAVSAGLYHSRGDAVLIIDADLQDPPEEMHRLIEKWREGYQVVYAVRTKRKDGLVKRFLAWAFYRVIARAVPFKIPARQRRFLFVGPESSGHAQRHAGAQQVFARSARLVWIPANRDSRSSACPRRRDASIHFQQIVCLALDCIFSFSAVPLRLASHFGLWVSILALIGVVFTFCQRVFRAISPASAWGRSRGSPPLLFPFSFRGCPSDLPGNFGRRNLGRIYDEVKGRPLWLIQDSVGLESKAPPGRASAASPPSQSEWTQ